MYNEITSELTQFSNKSYMIYDINYIIMRSFYRGDSLEKLEIDPWVYLINNLVLRFLYFLMEILM